MTNAQQAKEILKKFKSEYGWKFWDEAIDFLLDWQREHSDLGIITCDELDDLVEYKAHNGYQSMANFLSGIIGNLNNNYYRIDGYGNAETVDDNDIE